MNVYDPVHKTLSPEKWQSLGLNQELANIGSEVSRIIHWREARDESEAENALERALELVDLTLTDKRWRTGWSEIARLRGLYATVLRVQINGGSQVQKQAVDRAKSV
jgi:hypothetical protein